MKQIFENQYIKSFRFTSQRELSFFISNQNAVRVLSLDEYFGDYYYCYLGYHSLTGDKIFAITFSSDEVEDNLNLLFWTQSDLLVVDTGKNLYLINSDMSLRAVFEIITPLIGLYLTSKRELLILEEATLKLISIEGEVLKNELFDLIEDFSIENDNLSIQTSEEIKVFELS